MLNRYVTEQRIAGAVAAVARHGRVGYLQAVGFRDLETRAPMTERSLFRQSSPANPDQIRQRFKAIVDQAIVGR